MSLHIINKNFNIKPLVFLKSIHNLINVFNFDDLMNTYHFIIYLFLMFCNIIYIP